MLLIDKNIKRIINNIAEINSFTYCDILSISVLFKDIPTINSEFGEKYTKFSPKPLKA